MDKKLIYQRGHSIMEYTIASSLLAAAFFLPVNNSLALQFIRALQISYQNFSFALSLPL